MQIASMRERIASVSPQREVLRGNPATRAGPCAMIEKEVQHVLDSELSLVDAICVVRLADGICQRSNSGNLRARPRARGRHVWRLYGGPGR